MTRGPMRSWLFVPADNERLLASAVSRPADVLILDLEDGTAPVRKEAARQGLPGAIGRVAASGRRAAVRINGELNTAVSDLRAAVRPGLDVVVLPKVEHPRDVQLLSGLIGELEREAGMAAGTVRLLLQIESCAALPRLHEIAAADPRIWGLMLGSEDYALDCGAEPTPDALYVPSLMIVHAARAAGVRPIGFIGSIAALDDGPAFDAMLERSRALGFCGAVVVHPRFLDAINRCHTPGAEQVRQAQQVVAAFEAALQQGLGAVSLDGRMIDRPVYRRALRVLAEREG